MSHGEESAVRSHTGLFPAAIAISHTSLGKHRLDTHGQHSQVLRMSAHFLIAFCGGAFLTEWWSHRFSTMPIWGSICVPFFPPPISVHWGKVFCVLLVRLYPCRLWMEYLYGSRSHMVNYNSIWYHELISLGGDWVLDHGCNAYD